jgi:hypothetical protein
MAPWTAGETGDRAELVLDGVGERVELRTFSKGLDSGMDQGRGDEARTNTWEYENDHRAHPERWRRYLIRLYEHWIPKFGTKPAVMV